MAVDAQGWLDWAMPHPGPSWKQGYPGIPARPYDNIEGAVYHSAEGSYTALLNEIQHPTRQASWHFSVAKDGTVAQHYPITAVCWHCGDMEGNVKYVGIEHAGVAGEALTFKQTDATVRITEDLRAATGAGAKPPARRVNLWEHREISPVTSCPSNRIPWNAILAKLEDNVDVDEHHEKVKQLIINADNNSAKRDTAIDTHGDERDKALSAKLDALDAKLDAMPSVALSELDYAALAKALLKEMANE